MQASSGVGPVEEHLVAAAAAAPLETSCTAGLEKQGKRLYRGELARLKLGSPRRRSVRARATGAADAVSGMFSQPSAATNGSRRTV